MKQRSSRRMPEIRGIFHTGEGVLVGSMEFIDILLALSGPSRRPPEFRPPWWPARYSSILHPVEIAHIGLACRDQMFFQRIRVP
jgi:hypothetical protein